MNTEQLTEVLLDESERFNRTTTDATADTVVEDVISASPRVDGNPSDQQVFQTIADWNIHANAGKQASWPDGWPKLSFGTLADALAKSLLMLLLFIGINFSAKSQLTVNLSAIKTELKQGAIGFGITYLKNLDSIYGGKLRTTYGNHSIFVFTPQFDIQSGTADAMNGISVKLTGMDVTFKTKQLSGMTVADLSKTFFVFPFSAGVESNNSLSFVNGLFEAGIVPWFGPGKGEFLKHIDLGLYAQAGYKFKIDTVQGIGGAADQSNEALNSNLLRLKGAFAIDTKKLFSVGLVNFGIVGNANAWYDILNHATYYQLKGVARFYLANGNSLDMNIDKGSGAPLFNSGTQFGVGLTVRF